MKHLLSIMAVFLLMGCQTNDNTPKNIASPEKVEHTEEKKEVEPELLELPNPVIVSKPILCGDSGTIIKGIVETHKERPIGWFISKQASTDEHKVLIMANLEKGTVSILEYPNPNTACFLVVGEKLEMATELKPKKTKSNPVSHKRVLTLN